LRHACARHFAIFMPHLPRHLCQARRDDEWIPSPRMPRTRAELGSAPGHVKKRRQTGTGNREGGRARCGVSNALPQLSAPTSPTALLVPRG
jgi:hypothetical protein